MNMVMLNGGTFVGQTVTTDHYEMKMKVCVMPVEGYTHSQVARLVKDSFQMAHEVTEIKTVKDGVDPSFLVTVNTLYPVSQERIQRLLESNGLGMKSFEVVDKTAYCFSTRAA